MVLPSAAATSSLNGGERREREREGGASFVSVRCIRMRRGDDAVFNPRPHVRRPLSLLSRDLHNVNRSMLHIQRHDSLSRGLSVNDENRENNVNIGENGNDEC